MEQWLDWPAFGFLALLTLLDGLRRVPAGALVLRRAFGGKWAVVEMREGYRMVSWWPPLAMTVVLAPPTGEPLGRGRKDELEGDFEKARGRVLTLQVLGLLSLAALVVVVPVAIRWWGGMGFLSALLGVLALSWLITGLSYHFSKPLNLTTRQRLLFALPRMNPFATPAAGEALLERTLREAEPLAVAKLLIEESEFARWIRPLAYDWAEGLEVERGDELMRVVGRKRLKEIITTRPARVEAHSPWCPRCGSEFGSASTECPTCEIPLII